MLSRLGGRNVFAELVVQAMLCLQLVLEFVSVCAKRIHLDRGIPRPVEAFQRCVTTPGATGKRGM
jgi:hypothetical protein